MTSYKPGPSLFTKFVDCDCSLSESSFTESCTNFNHKPTSLQSNVVIAVYALVNQFPHHPPPGPMRGFDKGVDERPFPQGGAFDMTPFNLCWLKSSP